MGMIGESLGNLAYLIRDDPLRAFGWTAGMAFGVIWVTHQTFPVSFAFQTYLLTFLVFVEVPLRTEKLSIRKPWFWKAMLGAGIPIHALFLTTMYRWELPHAGHGQPVYSLFGMVLALGVAEIVVLAMIVDRFRPKQQE